MEDHTKVIMELIINGGHARALAMKAIYSAKKADYEEANQLINESTSFLQKAHNGQTNLLTQEAKGHQSEITLLMIHAQDHLMNAITVLDLAKEIIDVYKKISCLGGI